MVSSALNLLLFSGLALGSLIDRRQLAPAVSTTSSNAQVTRLSEVHSISKNHASLNSNASTYYLGYREEDLAKPYAKFWNPNVPELSDETQKGISSSPHASKLTFTANEAAKIMLEPGYLQMENGYAIDDEGTVIVAVRSEIPQVTGEMYDWWFGWHTTESARYKLWNPVAHQYAYRKPDSEDWSNKTYAERYWGMVSWIDEFAGNSDAKLSIEFIPPSELGVDTAKWAEAGIETMVVGKIFLGEYVSEGFDNISYLIHQVRRKPDGYRELRSRFWIAHGTPQLGHDLAVHCFIEMTHLGTFLPELFAEFKDTV